MRSLETCWHSLAIRCRSSRLSVTASVSQVAASKLPGRARPRGRGTHPLRLRRHHRGSDPAPPIRRRVLALLSVALLSVALLSLALLSVAPPTLTADGRRGAHDRRRPQIVIEFQQRAGLDHTSPAETAHMQRVIRQPQREGRLVFETCEGSWIFDLPRKRFCRSRRLPGPFRWTVRTPWRRYVSLVAPPQSEFFAVVLDADGVNLRRAWRHRGPCRRCHRVPSSPSETPSRALPHAA